MSKHLGEFINEAPQNKEFLDKIVEYTKSKEFLELYLKRLELLYSKYPNPFYAWEAYKVSRSNGFTIPDFVFSYLDSSANNLSSLSSLAKPHIKDADKAYHKILVALGMKSTGAGTFLTRYRKTMKDGALASLVHMHIQMGMNETDSIYLVAEKQKRSEATVRRIWKKYEDMIA
ncbi:MAG: hypothetical protein B6D73_15225 [gamma proteobacterium symbiont of Stewartia floridana]|nr:MAG: hypothetical protein B6D73_15225 [gamma proteobacterium symbiont of Stewartia floridana]